MIAVGLQEGRGAVVRILALDQPGSGRLLGVCAEQVRRLLFSQDSEFLVVGETDGTVAVHNLASDEPAQKLPKGWDLGELAFIPRTHRLIVGHEGDGRGVRVWDWATNELCPLEPDRNRVAELVGTSPDGTRAVVAWRDDVISVFEAGALRLAGVLHGHQAGLRAMAFSPVNELLATGSMDRTARLWDLRRMGELAILGGHPDQVSDVLFAANGHELITISGDGTIKVWDVAMALKQNVIITDADLGWRFALAPNGEWLAAGGAGKALHLWNPSRGSEILSISAGEFPPNYLAAAPNGRWVAWLNARTLRIMDLASGVCQTNVIADNSTMGGVEFSPDSSELACTSHTNVLICEMRNRRLSTFASFSNEVYALSYSPSGSLLALGHQGGAVSLWDIKLHRCLTTIPGAHMALTACVRFSRDGLRLASSGSPTITLWRVTGRGLAIDKTLRARAGYVPAVAWSPDGTRLVSCSSDHTLTIWDTAEGREVGTLYGHQAYVSDVTFSKDGNRIFSIGGDGTVRMWEASLADTRELH
jgi:WD40 repeat protein